MRAITHCPVCQTQFFVTDEQLNKHGGKVRCGQCLHVFDAKAQFITADLPPQAHQPELPPEPPLAAENTNSDMRTASALASPSTSQDTSQDTPQSTPQSNPPSNLGWPAIHDDLLADDESFNNIALNQTIEFHSEFNRDQEPEVVELFATSDEIKAFAAEISEGNTASNEANKHSDVDDTILIDDSDFDAVVIDDENDKNTNDLNDITKLTFIANNGANYFNDLAKLAKRNAKKTLLKKSYGWLWLAGTIISLLVAIAQSIYFLRNEIATHYPNVKPYLVNACQQLGCSVNLPKQIEFIMIDDSDMQEDLTHTGLIHFSSNLINKAGFHQTYPNLELTLTNVDDKPLLRKVFKPSEYLPAGTDVASGFKANDEVSIKLVITTQGISVSGYRVFVSY